MNRSRRKEQLQMNRIAAMALLLTATVSVAQSSQPSLTGKWTLHQSVAGNDSDSECTFTQKDSDLSGTCGTGDQSGPKITGKVDGTKVTWSSNSDYNGTALTMKYSGKLEDGKITGTLTIDPFGVDGDFTATLGK
jgi:hypothetical protein